jgi:hypothetical protein
MNRALARLDHLDANLDTNAHVDEVLWPPDLGSPGPRDWAPGIAEATRPTTIRGSLDGSWVERHLGFTWIVVTAVLVSMVFFASRVDQFFPAKADVSLGEHAPPAGVGAAEARILPAVKAPKGQGDYAFTMTQPHSDEPVTWDPCRPIHYVVRLGSAGSQGMSLVREAVAQISQASGLEFIEDGQTNEAPTKQRDAYQPDRYGERWAPVLIAWSSPTEEPNLADDVAGLGGSEAMPDTKGHLTYVTGNIWLDTPALKPYFTNKRARPLVVSTIVHELGHVLGAAHVASQRELMFKEASVTKLGVGDRQGLALLGQGACAPGL